MEKTKRKRSRSSLWNALKDYYFHQTNANYLLHAATYLSNKAFLNEY